MPTKDEALQLQIVLVSDYLLCVEYLEHSGCLRVRSI